MSIRVKIGCARRRHRLAAEWTLPAVGAVTLELAVDALSVKYTQSIILGIVIRIPFYVKA